MAFRYGSASAVAGQLVSFPLESLARRLQARFWPLSPALEDPWGCKFYVHPCSSSRLEGQRQARGEICRPVDGFAMSNPCCSYR